MTDGQAQGDAPTRDPIGDVEDVRLVLLVEADLDHAPDAHEGWAAGPEPLLGIGPSPEARRDGYASEARRRTYFRPRVASVLYGDERRTVRWHSTVDFGGGRQPMASYPAPPVAGAALAGLEVVHFEVTGGSGSEALLLVHLRLASLEPALGRLARPDDEVRTWLTTLFEPVARPRPVRRARTVVFARRRDADAVPFPASCPPGWAPAEQWLWYLASASDFKRFPPSTASHDEAKAALALSSHWSALVLRDGAAFVAAPSDEDFVRDHAPWLVVSGYCDALALSVMQRACLEGFAEALAELKDPRDPSKRTDLRKIEDDFARFRNRYWWQQLAAGSHAEPILTAHAKQVRSGALFDQIVAELAEYSRQAERDQLAEANALQAVSNAIVATVTVIAAVIAVPLTILQLDDVLPLGVRLAIAGVLLLAFAGYADAHRAYLRRLIIEPIRAYGTRER